jgi:uroporphyrin-III C-methyltransferase
MRGKVYLVGAGPGDPELLTLKALRLLNHADVVLHDELVGAEILGCIRSAAKLHNVGKRNGHRSTPQAEIHTLLVQYASMGLQVVRLKGGDPLVFGRAGEEIEALRAAGIEFEVIPGVTSALGAAASTQIPLTHRELASSFLVLTGHRSSAPDSGWPASIPPGTTVVVYMPGYDYSATSAQLEARGVNPATPCAVISRATLDDQKIYRTTLQDLPSAPQLPSPTLLVVGEVVRLAKPISQKQEMESLLPAIPDAVVHNAHGQERSE